EKRLAGAGERLRVLRGHARFVAAREIEVDGARYRAETVVINVGARPAAPPIDGLAQVPWLDNARIMELRALPRHLLILGGGYIGCEFGQMFRRFGADVTIVDHAEHLLAREDVEASVALEEVFRAEGIALELGAKIERVASAGDEIVTRLAGGREVRG